jgi:CBS domain-containing protein
MQHTTNESSKSAGEQTSQSHASRDQALDELAALRDRVKLRFSLFSMNARDRWQELESKISDWEARIDRDGEQMTEAAIARFRELMRNAREFLNEPSSTDPSPLDAPVSRLIRRPSFYCSPSDPLNRAAQLMWEGDVRAVAVVDHGRVIGVINDRDVSMACYTQGCAPAHGNVASAMSRNVECCEQTTSIEQALLLMTRQRLEVVPILDENRQLCGTVTLGSIARFIEALSGDQQARGLFLLGRAVAAVGSV